MYAHSKDVKNETTQRLRKEAGVWLSGLRRDAGLSQRDLAQKIGSDFYTFISQIENGKGRIPPDKYRQWAAALDIDAKSFVESILKFYDPATYAILFGAASDEVDAGGEELNAKTKTF